MNPLVTEDEINEFFQNRIDQLVEKFNSGDQHDTILLLQYHKRIKGLEDGRQLFLKLFGFNNLLK